MIASGAGQDIEAGIVKVGEIDVLATIMDGADKDLMRSSIDKFKDKHVISLYLLYAFTCTCSHVFVLLYLGPVNTP